MVPPNIISHSISNTVHALRSGYFVCVSQLSSITLQTNKPPQASQFKQQRGLFWLIDSMVLIHGQLAFCLCILGAGIIGMSDHGQLEDTFLEEKSGVFF